MKRARHALSLGGETFATQQAALSRIRKVLYGYPFNAPIGGSDFALLHDLLNRHPEVDAKIGCGLGGFVVRPNPVYPGNRGFWLVRHDGSLVDWSFMECLHASSHAADVRQAMRRAVAQQIIDYKNSAFDYRPSVPCAITGETCTRDDCHVDHAPPTFHELAACFAEQFGGYEAIRLSLSVDGQIGRDLDHPGQLAAWQAFHRANARLRIVTRQANLSLLRRRAGVGLASEVAP